MELPSSPETSRNGADYELGRPLDSDDVSADASASSASEDDSDFDFKAAQSDLDDKESDRVAKSSSKESTDFADNPSRGKPALPASKDSICKECGRGPFRSIRLHMRHCTGLLGKKIQCFRCRMYFVNEAALKEHCTVLYTCDVCGQVFSKWDPQHQHQPPKRGHLRLSCFCSESMPKACAMCKSFFDNEKLLLAHVSQVHTSVVSTKFCITGKPSVSTDVAAKSATEPKRVFNGWLPTDHTYSFPAAAEKKHPEPIKKKHPEPAEKKHPEPTKKKHPEPTEKKHPEPAEKKHPEPAEKKHPEPAQKKHPEPAEKKHPEPAPSAPQPTILALFENQSQELASTKRTNTSRCSRAPRTCRQCGTILRQPYLAISHRYLHRGSRSHRCQCGRAFKHRLHLLRHCVQHAEAKSYICVNCGNTFTGARLLAEHLRGKPWKKKTFRGKCRMPLACSCGHFFYRASAYIWHQIKNNVKTSVNDNH